MQPLSNPSKDNRQGVLNNQSSLGVQNKSHKSTQHLKTFSFDKVELPNPTTISIEDS